MRKILTVVAAAFILAFTTPNLHAQFAGTPLHDNFRDTSILRPPAGSNVAIIVFEDLGCPACARAHPIELQAAEKDHVKIMRYDFPLAAHIWTFDGAVFARYLQDKVNSKLADEYRTDVFATQRSIFTKEDLQRFNQHWMQQHTQKMPFAVDPDGSLAGKVRSDYELGQRLNVEFTPTIVVVTRNQYQVVAGTRNGPNDPTQLIPILDGAIAQAKTQSATSTAPVQHTGKHNDRINTTLHPQ